MKSITIHKMSDELVAKIESYAQAWDLSLNKTVKRLLSQIPEQEEKPEMTDNEKIRAIAAEWGNEDVDEIDEAIKFFDVIDEEMWK